MRRNDSRNHGLQLPDHYLNVGVVNFPVHSPDFKDEHDGILTVRLIVEDQTVQKPYTPVEGPVIQPDDMLIGTDVHETAKEAFEFLETHPEPFLDVMLLGAINWMGRKRGGSEIEVWKATPSDLNDAGKELYEKFRYSYTGCRLILVTSVNRKKEKIDGVMSEAKMLNMPVEKLPRLPPPPTEDALVEDILRAPPQKLKQRSGAPC